MEYSKQVKKYDILCNLLNLIKLSSSDIFNIIISDNMSNPNSQRQGAIFETLCILLQITKCITINYTNILVGSLNNLKSLNNFNEVLNTNIHQGNNKSDMTIKQDKTIIAFSIKFIET